MKKITVENILKVSEQVRELTQTFIEQNEANFENNQYGGVEFGGVRLQEIGTGSCLVSLTTSECSMAFCIKADIKAVAELARKSKIEQLEAEVKRLKGE